MGEPSDAQPGPETGLEPWRAVVVGLFPGMFPGPLGDSLAGKALERGQWRLETVDIRSFARDKHASVDDTPFGGGAGMVMRPDVVDAALHAVEGSAASNEDAPPKDKRLDLGPGTIGGLPAFYLSPRGRRFDQNLATELAKGPGVVLLCGRYEGIDQRVIDAWQLEELSLGDFVLSGGEPAALCVLDAVVRLLPGVMGNAASGGEESFTGRPDKGRLLEYPHYTRPAEWRDGSGVERMVPDVLVSGHHAKVKAWRDEQAEEITRARRPDLLDAQDGR